jgi:hypothetical protein
VLQFFWMTFTIATVLNLPRAMFGVHYPGWTMVIGWTVTSISVAAFVVFLAMRAGEILSTRPQ